MNDSTNGRHPDEETLLRGCRDGEPRAWERLIHRYRRLIYSVPTSGFRLSSEDADEIFQRVVVKLFDNVGRIRSVDSLPSWLVTVTRNECRRLLSNTKRWQSIDHEAIPEPGEDPPDIATAIESVACEHRLALAFERLDDRSRSVLSAFFLEESAPSYATIARRLGRPLGSLGPTRARCLAKLRRHYVELGGSESDAAIAPRAETARQASHRVALAV